MLQRVVSRPVINTGIICILEVDEGRKTTSL